MPDAHARSFAAASPNASSARSRPPPPPTPPPRGGLPAHAPGGRPAAHPSLAAPTVAAERVADSVRVGVSTVDEVPVVGGARFRGTAIEALSIGTMNFLGAGAHVEGRWEHGRVYREGFGGKLAH